MRARRAASASGRSAWTRSPDGHQTAGPPVTGRITSPTVVSAGDRVDAVRDRLAASAVSKGTLRFTAGDPLPDDVVADLVRRRVAEIETGPTG